LADLVERVTDKLAAGDASAAEALLHEHPDAERLRHLLPTLEVLAGLRSSVGRASGLPASAAVAGLPTEPPHLTARSPAPHSLTTLGDFRLIREIGRGGMGIVYEAEQISLHRRVALKILPLAALLDDRLLKRFQIEAQAAAGLSHENIVPIYAVGCDQGIHYYAMQLIDGVSLAEVIAAMRAADTNPTRQRGSHTSSRRKQGDSGQETGDREDKAPAEPNDSPLTTHPLTFLNLKSAICNLKSLQRYRWAAELGIQAAQALHHAHEQGIIHRDIKPGNLLLDKNGKLWITDFGLARIEGDASLTMVGDLLGTLRYMSPEQVLGDGAPLQHRIDVYSLGATLYELLTWQPAVTGANRVQILRQLAEDVPRPPRKLDAAIPRDLEIILLKSLARDPADRYASAAHLAADLQRFLDSKPIAARRPIRSIGLRPVLLFIAASILLIATLVTTPVGNALRGVPNPDALHGVPAVEQVSGLPIRSPVHPRLGSAPRDEASLASNESDSVSPEPRAPSQSSANPQSAIRNPQFRPAPIPPPPGLIAWWSGDGTANDLLGNRHGKLINGAKFAPGLIGQAFSFDGRDDFVRIPYSHSLDTPAGFTAEGWIRVVSIPGTQNIISRWLPDSQNRIFSFQRELATGTLCLHVEPAKREKRQPTRSAEPILPGVWTHVAATCNPQAVKVYCNGKLNGTAIGSSTQLSSSDLLLGASTGEQGVNCYFSGLIDELSLYNRALDASEIAAIHHAGAAGKIKPSTIP
jgi:serine/threonine protein kinase